MNRSGARLAEGLFRLMLRLFPVWFLDAYRSDMIASFKGGLADARAEGWWASVAFVSSSCARVIPAALRVRKEFVPMGPGESRSAGSRLGDDLRHATRTLVRAPGWTAAALLILTLGIGGTTAIFSLLNAVLLRPLPFEQPEQLVSMWSVNLRQDIRDGSSWENATDWLDRGSSLSDVALVFRPEFTSSTISSFGRPERIHVGWVSPNFFDLLGVRAVTGRVFDEADLATDGRLVVIDEALWELRYARDPGVVGRLLTLDGEEYRIVGVVPDDLTIPLRETSVWRLQDVRTATGQNWRGFDGYWVLGRMGTGMDLEATRADLAGVAADLASEFPETNRNSGVRVTPLRDEMVGDDLPVLLWTLFGSTLIVLLVGATNVAQLMLSRGLARTRELAIRASLGATRGMVNRQLVLESVLLSATAGVAGVVLASLGLDGLLAIVPPDVPLAESTRIDGPVLGVALLLTGVVGPIIGLLPALTASRTNVGATMRSGGRGSTSKFRRTRSSLVIGEVAMAVVLLGAAGLLARSAVELRGVDPGFEARNTLLARVDLTPADEGASLAPIHEELLARLGSMPTVLGVGGVSQFFIERFPDQTINLVGESPRPAGEPAPRLTTDAITPGFFEALGVPLLRGRSFTAADIADPNFPTQMIVNQTWAETFSPDSDPVGKQFRWGDAVEGDVITVVGVVGDLRRTALEETSYPQMFTPAAVRSFYLAIRSDGDPRALVTPLMDAVAAVDPDATVSDVSTAWDRYTLGLAPRRFQTVLLESFAFLGTLLAAIGLFAILHETVAARRREIGIRIALGAAPESVWTHVLGRGLGLTGAGLAIGLFVLVLLSDLTGRLVFGVGSTDPLTFGAVGGVVLLVCAIAAFVPARQATRISPAEALTDQ